MEDAGSGTDFRINARSKAAVREQLEKYKNLLNVLLDGQCQISEDDGTKLLQEMMASFEFTVQENVTIAGLSWDEASEERSEDHESGMKDALDEKIVETAWKRSSYPKQIRNQVVRRLRAERKLLGLYEQAVKPQDIKSDPVRDTIVRNLSAAAPTMFKQASTVMKSLNSLRQAAEGLRQVLNTQPSAESEEIYRAVFCSSVTSDRPDLHRRPSSIKRAVSEAEYSADYVPAAKIKHSQIHSNYM